MSLHADDLTSLDAYSNVSRRDGSKQTIIPSHPCRDNHCEDTRFEEGGGEDGRIGAKLCDITPVRNECC